ncbi:serine/threonine-protein kinase [Streptomyces sp. NPDC051784]|uniref:serine/threonine-protein kinase n=1 Tax=Streptomyces sp. NPDC051784 TaxID=3155805 RepID=UPI003423FE1D
MKPLGAADPVRIGPYALAGKLGAGGMGEVYLGRSSGGRTVAVKVVRADLAHDPAFRVRFQREVKAARRVSGAFTAPVVDADTEAEVPWMATRFVVGLSLHACVEKHGPLPEDALRMLTAGLAEALLSVHGAEVIHRDLKPANVLLALDGPHVIDFGIARATDGTVLTSTGSVIGSAPYMSPEQAVGESLTPASDVFSLASTVAFAAGGASPFGDGAGAAVLFRVVHTEPDLGFVPETLRPLIRRCLAKNPRERPGPREVITYAELAERNRPAQRWAGWLPEPVAADVLELRAALTVLPTPAPTTPLGGPDDPALVGGEAGVPASHGSRPSRRALILGLSGGAVALAGGVGAWALSGKGEDTDRTKDSGGSKGGSASSRPSGDDVQEADLAWQVRQQMASTQVVPADGITACVAMGQVTGVDRSGNTKWTVKVPEGGMTFATGSTPMATAGLFDGRLHVGLGMMADISLSDPEVGESRTALLSFRVSDGKDPRTVELTKAPGMGLSAFCGVRDGLAHVVSMSGQGTASGSFGVWAVGLDTGRTAFYEPAQGIPVSWAIPSTGGGMVYATVDRVVALDTKGAVAWSAKDGTTSVASAGRFVVLVDSKGALSAREPKSGREVWKAEGAVVPSLRGDGIATDTAGKVLYALWTVKDGGFSLAALDVASGEVRWKTPIPADAKGSPYTGARILYADGNVYRMGGDGMIWAFNAANGKPRWKYSGWKGTDPSGLAWSAGDGQLCLSKPSTSTVAALNANGA